MENLIFSLNATIPIFLMMLLGMLFRKLGWMDEVFAAKMNKFVFLVPLPVLLFEQLATVDFSEVWDIKFILFCFVVTAISITISTLISLLWKDRSIKGEFIQATYRSSAALLGIAFIQNIYGTAGMAPLMIIGSVPLYNIMAVVVLSVFKPGNNSFDKALVKKTLKGIATNPIIIGIVAGFVWSALKLPMPSILHKTVSSIGATATPMGLMSMGATFEMKKATSKMKPTLVAVFMKLVGFCAIFLPMAALLGFRNEELIAILVMLGSATTVSCFVMARNMGHEGTLSSGVIMMTTLLSAFTLTMWLDVLRSFGLV
ncbi:AEC family transporter [Coprococcus comes]|uniref:AEC family transporter n=1 Tax=Coprococcus comes TaxID=410072 RepID=UPI00156DEFE4|nr:AEC family transporter [Coprococcus comes]MCB6473634.1 AEC family transporter [Coprococcus comes]NSC15809.1 AEC family transporter [Coprococcus comes]NSC18970.1 AEC family transporter [Coprococcus comes]NSC31230.1 AEC family transporter [Coprococcus comes]NSC68790.1 AEC family transporter [Coprococcus comes]